MKQTNQFAKLCRQNTGSHFMDSGGATGRHWQQPLPKDEPYFELHEWTMKDDTKITELSVYIPTHTFLNDCLEVDKVLTRKLRSLEKKAGKSFNSNEAAKALAQVMGLVHYDKWTNTYNHDNNFTQDFQFDIFGSEENQDYYFEPDDSDPVYITLETHNGADIRGGYSDTVVCKLKSYGFWTHVAGIRVSESYDVNGVINTDLEKIGDIRTDRCAFRIRVDCGNISIVKFYS